MRVIWPVVFAASMLVACGSDETLTLDDVTPSDEALCTSSLSWQQASGANPWWVEYSIGGGSIASAFLEVVGQGTVPLSANWGKWVGATGFPIASGTRVVVHAVTAAGDTGQTVAFRYLVDVQPASEDCGGACVPDCNDLECGDDGCGGSCGTCPSGQSCSAGDCVSGCVAEWNPVWQQASGANNWWVEYTISGGAVTAAHLEVVGIGDVPLSNMFNKWVGATGFLIPTGTPVIVHAQNALAQSAQTVSFGYLAVALPATDACDDACTPACGGRECGDDGCGGSCGSCMTGEQCVVGVCAGSSCEGAWQPTFTQGSGANAWWVEYQIQGGSVTSAYLEVSGGASVTLSNQFGKWVGSPSAAIPSGAQVIVHATNAQNQTAQTKAFAYLVVTAPASEPCAATPPSGRIAFWSTREFPAGGSRLYLGNPDGTGVSALTQGSHALEPAWSPDGREIAYTQQGGIAIIDVTSASERFLVAGYAPSWGPDGTKLTYVNGFGTVGGGTPTGGIYVIDAEGSNAILRLGHAFAAPPSGEAAPFDDYYVHAPAWSPDGQSIAFVRYNTVDEPRIYVMSAAGSDSPTFLVEGTAPAWSPDGSRIAYVRSYSQLVSMSITGAGETTHASMGPQGVIYDPAWSPDGRRLVFQLYQGGRDRIYIVREDGSVSQLFPDITNSANPSYIDAQPAWSWGD